MNFGITEKGGDYNMETTQMNWVKNNLKEGQQVHVGQRPSLLKGKGDYEESQITDNFFQNTLKNQIDSYTDLFSNININENINEKEREEFFKESEGEIFDRNENETPYFMQNLNLSSTNFMTPAFMKQKVEDGTPKLEHSELNFEITQNPGMSNMTQSNFHKVKESTFGANSFLDRDLLSQSEHTNDLYQAHLRKYYEENPGEHTSEFDRTDTINNDNTMKMQNMAGMTQNILDGKQGDKFTSNRKMMKKGDKEKFSEIMSERTFGFIGEEIDADSSVAHSHIPSMLKAESSF